MKWWDITWLWTKWKRRLTKEQKESRQIQLLKLEVLHSLFSDMGIEVLVATLEQLTKNRKELGHSDYTSLAEIWLESQEEIKSRRVDSERNGS